MGKFVIRAVNSGVKFDLRAANGQVILTSEVYASAAACRKGIESVRKCAAATVEDLTVQSGQSLSHPKYQLYRDKNGGYRFRLRSRNGKIIAVSESYTSCAGCLAGIESVRQNAPDAQTVQL